MAELVRVRREGAVAVLTLNRPEKLNALSSSVEEALAAAVGSEEVATSAALVIEGSGRAFSAGAAAVFGLPEVAIGIVPSSGGLTRLVRSVGAARAKELMLLRDRFDAQEALGFGLVTARAEER